MKIKINTPIKDLKGRVQKNQDGDDFLAKEAIGTALALDTKETDPAEKYRRYVITKKILDSNGEVELKAEEVAAIKKAVGDFYLPFVQGQIWDLVDGEK
jgi:hypothetical protein